MIEIGKNGKGHTPPEGAEDIATGMGAFLLKVLVFFSSLIIFKCHIQEDYNGHFPYFVSG